MTEEQVQIEIDLTLAHIRESRAFSSGVPRVVTRSYLRGIVEMLEVEIDALREDAEEDEA